MNRHQINNIFYFLGIMKYGGKLLTISPDYLSEKSLAFFGNLGSSNCIPNILTLSVWKSYCKTWKIKEDEYEILNIINFIAMSNFSNPKNVIKNYIQYMGNTEDINNYDVSSKVHPNILEHVNIIISNNRYLKLLSFKENIDE